MIWYDKQVYIYMYVYIYIPKSWTVWWGISLRPKDNNSLSKPAFKTLLDQPLRWSWNLPDQSKKHVIATAGDMLPCSVLGLLVLNLFRFAGPGQVHRDVDLIQFWSRFAPNFLSSKLVSLRLDWLPRLPVDGKTLACDLCDPSTELPHSRPKKSVKMNE